MELPKEKEKQTLTSYEFLPFKEQMPQPLVPFTALKFQGLQHYFWLLGAGLGLEYSPTPQPHLTGPSHGLGFWPRSWTMKSVV